MDWFAPNQPLLANIIDDNARARSHRLAFACGDSKQSWSEFRESVGAFAGGLRERGLAPGARVAILMDNSLPMAHAMLGAIYGGYVAVPINTSVSDAAVSRMAEDCSAAVIVASDQHVQRIEQCPANVSLRVACGGPAQGWTDLDAIMAAKPLAEGYTPSPVAECNIIYSSGTTGLPKGIVHSHFCRMAWANDMALALGYHSGARTICSLGLYSNITWVAMLATLLVGGSIHILPRFSIRGFIELVESAGITHGAMVPVQFQRLLADPALGEFDLTSVESLMCCGSPLLPELKRNILDKLPGNLIELYGLTEGLVTTLAPEDAEKKLESVGLPCPGQQLKILRADDSEADVDEAGEIVGYGRLLMSGYLNREDANREATWTDPTGRRWLRTGDIGRLDADGFLYLVDRKKDMILSGGQNIYPADIEAVLGQHPNVDDVAVIGVKSAKWGETPLAVVVSGGALDLADIKEWLNSRVGKQQRVADVIQIDELPRNPNGKILKRELRQLFADASY